MSGECESCGEHPLECQCTKRNFMEPCNKWLEEEIKEINEEVKKMNKNRCREEKKCLYFLFLLIPLQLYALACSGGEHFKYRDGSVNLNPYHNAKRIYYITGLKNIELLDKNVKEQVSDAFERNTCLKILQKYACKLNYEGYCNGQIGLELKEAFSLYICKCTVDEDDHDMMIKILDMMIYCFQTDDGRDQQPIWPEKRHWHEN